jgi:hypothetical protein
VTWRWIFWINLPFIGVGLAMIVLFLHINQNISSFMAKLARVDWVGTAFFIAATTGFLIPITWGGVMYDWDSWRTLVPLILCGIGLVAFVVYEIYVPAEPMIRMELFSNQTAAVSFFTTFLRKPVFLSRAIGCFADSLQTVSLSGACFTSCHSTTRVSRALARSWPVLRCSH